MKTIEHKIEQTTYTYACDTCNKEFSTPYGASGCEDQHTITTFKKSGDFIWFNTEEDASKYASANGAYCKGGDPFTPGWYFCEFIDPGDYDTRMYCNPIKEQIEEWEEAAAKIQKSIADARSLIGD
jgi:hypothetical protein